MILRATRFLGALSILAVGAIHLQQYIGADYRAMRKLVNEQQGCNHQALGLLCDAESLGSERDKAF